jgi:glycosyltransferase involved in cell wall biosynthesis
MGARMTGPTASISIPTYRYRRYVGDAIASALAQTRPADEVIVVENASNDGSAEYVAEAFGSRVRLVRQMRTVMSGVNWNRGFDEAHTEWVTLLHADDQLEPAFLETMLEAAQKDPAIVMVTCDYTVVDADNTPLRRHGMADFYGPAIDGAVLDGREIADMSFRRGDNPFGTTSMTLYRKDALYKIGGVDEHRLYVADWDIALRILRHGKFVHVSKALTRYREHGANQTNMESDRDDDVAGHTYFLELNRAHDPRFVRVSDEALERYRRVVAMRIAQRLEMPGLSPERRAFVIELARRPVFEGVFTFT